MNWADIILLNTMAKYFNIKFRYTPAIKYATDLENGHGYFEQFLKPEYINLSQSHLYIKQQEIDDILVFDKVGSDIAKDLANSYKGVCFNFKIS